MFASVWGGLCHSLAVLLIVFIIKSISSVDA